jgi:hypothetical protein
MLVRISEKFRRHYRLMPVSREAPVRPFPQTWNVDLRPDGRSQLLVMASEEHTLFSLLMPVSRSHKLEVFQDAFRARLRQFLDNIQWWKLPYLPFLTYCKRSDLSFAGSQTELWRLTFAYLENTPAPASPADLLKVEEDINSAPMSLLQMDSPVEALKKLLDQQRRSRD